MNEKPRHNQALSTQPVSDHNFRKVEAFKQALADNLYYTRGQAAPTASPQDVYAALAERLSMPERIAGLTANLGRVAQRRGETALAIHRLSTALPKAETLGLQHRIAQIRPWLAPLLPLAEARAIAESGGRKRLLEEIAQTERQVMDDKGS